MDLLTLATDVAGLVRAALDPWLCNPIGHVPQLKAIPLRILMSVEW
jgi:hypothetical protein